MARIRMHDDGMEQVGDSSGVIFSKSEMNQLMIVRALVRKPKVAPPVVVVGYMRYMGGGGSDRSG